MVEWYCDELLGSTKRGFQAAAAVQSLDRGIRRPVLLFLSLSLSGVSLPNSSLDPLAESASHSLPTRAFVSEDCCRLVTRQYQSLAL